MRTRAIDAPIHPQVDASEIVAASYAAAAYLTSVGFSGGKVLLVSDSGVGDELEQHAIAYSTPGDLYPAPAGTDPATMGLDEMRSFPLDPEARAWLLLLKADHLSGLAALLPG